MELLSTTAVNILPFIPITLGIIGGFGCLIYAKFLINKTGLNLEQVKEMTSKVKEEVKHSMDATGGFLDRSIDVLRNDRTDAIISVIHKADATCLKNLNKNTDIIMTYLTSTQYVWHGLTLFALGVAGTVILANLTK
jgi:hypothetical protein